MLGFHLFNDPGPARYGCATLHYPYPLSLDPTASWIWDTLLGYYPNLGYYLARPDLACGTLSAQLDGPVLGFTSSMIQVQPDMAVPPCTIHIPAVWDTLHHVSGMP